MRNIKLTLEYDGTEFCGWQIQKGRTIQGELEKVLSKILNEKIKIIGSGRTDSGVHALGQVANFKTNSKAPHKNIQKGLNSILPHSISVVKIEEVPLNFHARFDAKNKTYRYSILNSQFNHPLLNNHFYRVPYKLNFSLMREEIKCLKGRHNFKSFQASDKKEHSSIRTISKINLSKKRKLIFLDITSDGFLYNMVRNIIGTLIEIGRGKFPSGSMKKILKAKNRKLAGPTAPAMGLTLIKVRY
jgi:tRNA pseudouridine38-40 synthase